MYFTCYESILMDIEYHLAVKRLYKRELKKTAHCKGEWLRVREYKNRQYYTIVSNGEEKYVGAEDAHVKSIIKRRYLLEVLRRIDDNLALLSKVESSYRSINPNVIRNELPKAYRKLDLSMFELAGVPDMDSIENEYATPDGLYEDKRIQITDDGNLVRSKSETINIMLFNKLGIRFEYEKAACINGIWVYPDFKITSPNGEKRAYHEHFGMMSNPGYRAHNAKKIKDYIEAGLIPGYDVIFTFDYDGTINAYPIEQQLKLWINSPMSINIDLRFPNVI